MAEEEITGTLGLEDTIPSNFWAQLKSVNAAYPHIFVTKDKHSFGRLNTNDTSINDQKLSSLHCYIQKEIENQKTLYKVYDLSTNGTYINGAKIGKGLSKEIHNGDTIELLPLNMTSPTSTIAYVFIISEDSGPIKRKSSIEIKESEQKRKKLDDAIEDEMRCCICMEIIFQPVTVMPCLHNFCGGCYSQWMVKSVECPQCRKQVSEVKKNPTLNNLVEKHIENHPELKRSTQDIAEQIKFNKVTSDVLRVSEESKSKGRRQVTNLTSISFISSINSSKSDCYWKVR
jgi:E3 ubiquitin-protein ligase CHFR